MNTAMVMIDRLRDTSQSHNRCSVIEVMGRRCGDIALRTGIAVGATAILIPEIPFDFNTHVIEEIKAVATKINELTLENRAILDLTEYNKLLAQYNAYLEGLEIEIQPVITATKQVTFGEVATVAMAVIGTFGLLLALAFIKIA